MSSWALKNKDENALERTELKMLQWILGVTLMDRVRSADNRRQLGVVSSWALENKDENALERTELKMLRWILGVTLMDRVKSADNRRQLGVVSKDDTRTR